MEKVKEFFSSPKKTAILGLVGVLIMLLPVLKYTIGEDFFEFGIITLYNTYIWGLLFYFIVVLLRIFKKQGNIKIANYFLMITLLIPTIVNLFNGDIIIAIILVLLGLYLLNIFFRKKTFINNKVALVILLLHIIYSVIWNGRIFILSSNEFDYISQAIGLLLIIPYFYGYYELLKGENKNGK